MSSPIGTVQAAAVTARSAGMMRKLSSRVSKLETENAQLRTKVANYERGDRARGIATAMQDKGLNVEFTYEEKVASLLVHEDLDRVEEAVKMASTGSLDLASVSTDDGVPGRAGDSKTSFEAYCLTGDSGH